MISGIRLLGDFTITTSATYISTDVTENLEGMSAATIQVRFAYGSGGTNARAYVQTSIDQGTTWIDIISVLHTTSSEVAVFNISGLTPKTTAVVPGDGALADDTAIDGILGDMFRVKVVTIGTYSGQTTLSVRAAVR